MDTASSARGGTRRWALKAGLGAALALAGSAAPAADARTILRRGNGTEPDTLDPHQAAGHWEQNIIGDMLMGLTTDDPRGEPIPGCADTWKVSDDGLVWTFALRKGLVWSDGTPLTAADFVYAWRRVMDPETAARYAFLLYVVRNAEDINAGRRPKEELGIRAINDLTLEITLAQPAPFLPGLLRHMTSFPVPAGLVSRQGRSWVQPGTMVSNGPYVLAEYVPNTYVKLVKNPRFYDAGAVTIDEVFFYPIEDERLALTRFRADEIDMNITTTGFPIQQRAWLDENMPGQARVYPALLSEYIALNMRRPPFSDVRLRRAFSLMIDRDLLLQKVRRDGSVPAYSLVPPVVANYVAGPRLDFADWPMARRKAEATRLLAEAGYGPRRPLAFDLLFRSAYDRRRLVVAMTAILNEVGIVARPLANEAKVLYTRLQQDDFVAAELGWGADYNDPQTFLVLLETSTIGTFNYPGYSNPDFDRLMAEAKTMLDLPARAQVMARAEQIALDDCAVVPFNFATTKNLVAPRVSGFEDNADNSHPTRWLRLAPHG